MAVSTGKEQTQTSAEANMALPTGQGAQQLQTLIKDVAALDQALCQLQALQGRVKRLLATSQSDLTTILEQGTRNHIALLGEQESQQLRVAADNVGALELAFYQLKAAQINGATLADKVIQQVALTQTAMAVTTTDGSQKITIPEGNVAILKKAVRGLLAVQTNSAALDEAVKQFTASAQSFLAAGREQNGGQIRGNTAQTAPQTNI